MKSLLNSVQVEKNTLQQLLQRDLKLPPYQRRYCWGEQQVMQLLTDIENLLTPTDAKTVGDLEAEPVSGSQVPLF